MNQRISLDEVADHLTASLPSKTFPLLRVGTAYDSDYLTAYAKVFPAVWVGAQRLTKLDDGMAFTAMNRQSVRVEVAMRIVVQRYIAGDVKGAAESRLNALCDAVADVIKDWTPTGADLPFVWQSEQDGPVAESVMIVDAIFATTITYARVTP